MDSSQIDKVIAWPQGGIVQVFYPAPGQGDLVALAETIVPQGVPFLIEDTISLPSPEYRDAIRGDFSSPDGVGKAT